MALVTEHLEQQGAAFEVLAHRQAYTSIEEARAPGVDADEVLKTLAVRTGPGYVLAVIPAARRLDLQLVHEALGDNHPEVLGHDTVVFAAGTQTESVKMRTQELFEEGGFTTVVLVKQPERGNEDPVE